MRETASARLLFYSVCGVDAMGTRMGPDTTQTLSVRYPWYRRCMLCSWDTRSIDDAEVPWNVLRMKWQWDFHSSDEPDALIFMWFESTCVCIRYLRSRYTRYTYGRQSGFALRALKCMCAPSEHHAHVGALKGVSLRKNAGRQCFH